MYEKGLSELYDHIFNYTHIPPNTHTETQRDHEGWEYHPLVLCETVDLIKSSLVSVGF